MDQTKPTLATRSFAFSTEQVQSFADLSGDHNPIHLDMAYAATTPFGRPILHGVLGASVISALLASELPGPGTIYISQELKFLRPMYVSEPYVAIIEITSTLPEKHRIMLRTRITDERTGKACLDGQAEVMNASYFS